MFGKNKKTREEKLIEERMAVNETVEKMRRFVADLEPKKQLFIQKAREAREQHASSQEGAARSALKQVVAQQRLASEMLLNFEIMLGMRDITEMSGEFMKGMTSMSKQMSRLTVNMDFKKAEKQFNDAFLTASVQTEKMNEFLDKMSEGFGAALSSGPSSLSDEEIDGMIGYSTTKIAGESEKRVDYELEAMRTAQERTNRQ